MMAAWSGLVGMKLTGQGVADMRMGLVREGSGRPESEAQFRLTP